VVRRVRLSGKLTFSSQTQRRSAPSSREYSDCLIFPVTSRDGVISSFFLHVVCIHACMPLMSLSVSPKRITEDSKANPAPLKRAIFDSGELSG
jgi:hypothetical protein